MFKLFIKKSLKTLFFAFFLMLSFNFSFGAETTYAEELCNGGTDSICEVPVDTACESVKPQDEYTRDPNLSTDTRQICTKNTEGANTSLLDSVKMVISIQNVLNAIIWPVLVMIGGLMDNELLFGAGMEERLRAIWIIMRNLVNIMFVVVLVGIALYNILGLGDENSNYAIKSALPKIIVGIILVNFSFTLCKVVLDAVNVLTTSVFALPNTVSEELSNVLDPEKDAAKIEAICKSISGIDGQIDQPGAQAIQESNNYKAIITSIFDSKEISDLKIDQSSLTKAKESLNTIAAKTGEADADNAAKANRALTRIENSKMICEGTQLSETGTLFLDKWNQRNAAFAMAVNMGKVVFFNELHFSGLSSIDKTLVNSIMSMLVYFAFAAAFLALFVILLVRVIVLWVGIAVSPILIIIQGAPEIKENLGGVGEISDQFLKHAIAPLKIALALTVGWIMLQSLSSLNGGSLNVAFPAGQTTGLPVTGLSTIQDLIVSIAVLVVVFQGAFSAADGTLASSITGQIKEAAQGAASWVGQIPLRHLNVIPVRTPDGGEVKASPAEVLNYMQNLNRKTPDRLTNIMMGGKNTAGAEYFGQIKPKRGKEREMMERFIVGNKKSFADGDANFAAQLARNKNAPLYKALADPTGALYGSQMGRLFRDFISGDEAKRKSAGKALAGSRFAKGSALTVADATGGAAAAGAAAPGATTTPDTATPTAPKPVDSRVSAETTVVSGNNIDQIAEQQIKAQPRRAADQAVTTEEKTTFRTQYQTSWKEVIDFSNTVDTTKQAGLEKAITDMRTQIGTGLNQEEFFKNVLQGDTARRDVLYQNLGGGDKAKGEQKLKEILEPPAPAAGTATP